MVFAGTTVNKFKIDVEKALRDLGTQELARRNALPKRKRRDIRDSEIRAYALYDAADFVRDIKVRWKFDLDKKPPAPSVKRRGKTTR